jgi:hypothetical protein
LTPSLQLRASIPTVSLRRRAPYRNGAARAAAFSTGAELEARPLTFLSPSGPSRARRSESGRPRPLPPRSRQRARPSRPGTPSLDRCSHVSRLRAPGNPPPFSWLCRHRAGFKHLFHPPGLRGESWTAASLTRRFTPSLDKAFTLSGEGFRPRGRAIGCSCRLLQSLRFSSTTTDSNEYPARIAGSCPPALRDCGQPRTLRCRLAEVSRSRGRLGRNLVGASHARDSSRGELCPVPIGSDTSCHELVSTPGGEARRRIKERSSHESAGERHTRRRSR